MSIKYLDSKELTDLGSKLCSLPVSVKYLLVDSSKKLSFNVKIIKTSEMLRFFSSADLIVLVNKYFWDTADPIVREAYLYHELKHIKVSDSGKIKKVNHDIEEFIDVVTRYGAYKDELLKIKEIFKQDQKRGK